MMIRGERIPLRPSRYTCWASDFSYSRLLTSMEYPNLHLETTPAAADCRDASKGVRKGAMEDSAIEDPAVRNGSTEDQIKKSSNGWKDNKVLLLISLYNDNQDLFTNWYKKEEWEKISRAMKERGNVDVNPNRCSNKWKSLTAAYRRLRQHYWYILYHVIINVLLNWCFRKWPYVYGYKPNVHPIGVSGSGLTIENSVGDLLSTKHLEKEQPSGRNRKKPITVGDSDSDETGSTNSSMTSSVSLTATSVKKPKVVQTRQTKSELLEWVKHVHEDFEVDCGTHPKVTVLPFVDRKRKGKSRNKATIKKNDCSSWAAELFECYD